MAKKLLPPFVLNVPNILSLIRIIVTIPVLILIFTNHPLPALILFFMGMVTDFLDGQIARRCDQITEFGKKIDIIADRVLTIAAAMGFIIHIIFFFDGELGGFGQVILVFTRELIAFPAALYAVTSLRKIPETKYIGKVTTFIQAFAFPIVIYGIYFHSLIFTFWIALAAAVSGMISAIVFMSDVLRLRARKKKR